jgi:FAD reductase [NAD(P)H]
MKLLGISGCLTANSKTKKMVAAVLLAVNNMDSGIQTELLDLYDYDVQFCDGRDPTNYEGDTRKVIDKVAAADVYIIGTPIYQGSLTGALKNLFDLVPPQVFRHKVIGFVANGGTYQHFLVIENQLKPIAGYFHAHVAPGYVYAHNDYFNSQKEIVDQGILSRINELAEEVVHMSRQLAAKIVG